MLIVLYVFSLALAAITDSILKDDVKRLLEEKGYVDKNRLERAERSASGNVIEYQLTKEDIINWFKRNLWTLMPIANIVLIGACFIRLGSYDDNEEEFYAKWIEKLIKKEKVVACSEEELKNIQMIEEEMKRSRDEKITDFFKEFGININLKETIEEDTLEEELATDEDLDKLKEEILDEEALDEDTESFDDEEELEEDDDKRSTIEINISTPFGSKKYYRVIDSKKHGKSKLSKTEEDMVDKIMNSIDKLIDKADKKIDQAMDKADKKIDGAMDRFDKKFDKFDDKLDHAVDKFGSKIDDFGDGIDKAVDKVDEVIEKVLKL